MSQKRDMGHPASVVVLTSPGTWATRHSVFRGLMTGAPALTHATPFEIVCLALLHLPLRRLNRKAFLRPSPPNTRRVAPVPIYH